MKQILISFVVKPIALLSTMAAGAVVITLISMSFGFSVKENSSEKAAATVNQVQGVFIFIDSKPVAEYEYLGTVKWNGMTGNPQYTVIRDKLLKRIKKDWPSADGVIFNFSSGSADHADAIKFK